MNDRKCLVYTASYWFRQSRKAQDEGESARAIMCMEQAFNHTENALDVVQKENVKLRNKLGKILECMKE